MVKSKNREIDKEAVLAGVTKMMQRYLQKMTTTPEADGQRSRHRNYIIYILLLCLFASLPACDQKTYNTLTILYTSDTLGQIEPCG